MTWVADGVSERGAAERRRASQLRRRLLRLLLMIVLPLVVVLAGGWWYLTSGRYVSTDDAYVQSDMVTISSDVGGRVTDVEVHDNQKVSRGALLFKLDERPYRIAVERTKAQLAGARLQVEGLRATYRQKLSDLKAVQDTMAYQQREFD